MLSVEFVDADLTLQPHHRQPILQYRRQRQPDMLQLGILARQLPQQELELSSDKAVLYMPVSKC
jgi:hypothetical protein